MLYGKFMFALPKNFCALLKFSEKFALLLCATSWWYIVQRQVFHNKVISQHPQLSVWNKRNTHVFPSKAHGKLF